MQLDFDLKQTQALSPQMLQDMSVLQMGAMELGAYLADAFLENPVLEYAESENELPTAERAVPNRLHASYAPSAPVAGRAAGGRGDRESAAEALAADEPWEDTLYHHITMQLAFDRMDKELSAALRYILINLDRNGYLAESCAELAAASGLPEAALLQALETLQTLDPAGIGARTLSECLQLQLKRRGVAGLPLEIASDRRHLEAIGKGHFGQLAKALGATREEIAAANRLILTLDPRPGAAYGAREPLQTVIPDIVVRWERDHFDVAVNPESFPALSISPYYEALTEDGKEASARAYIAGKLREARGILQSLDMRKRTLSACAVCLVERQESFFHNGPGHLGPLRLRDIAEALALSESTVSRAVKDKYLQCDFGVYPLSFFFSRALPAADEGAVSAEKALSVIRGLIDAEDKRAPLSDQALCALLHDRGIVISRRTVAKYREQLGLPSTMKRRE